MNYNITKNSSSLDAAISASISLSMCMYNRPLDAASPCKFSGRCPKAPSPEDRCWYYVYVHKSQMGAVETLSWRLFLGVKYHIYTADIHLLDVPSSCCCWVLKIPFFCVSSITNQIQFTSIVFGWCHIFQKGISQNLDRKLKPSAWLDTARGKS